MRQIAERAPFEVYLSADEDYVKAVAQRGLTLGGGNIPGETKTIAISIYDRVQAFDDIAAATMSALLLVFSFSAIVIVQLLAYRGRRRDV